MLNNLDTVQAVYFSADPPSVKKLTSERKTMATCSPCPIRSFGLSGRAAAGLPIEKRGRFLMRLVAQLQLRSHFTTADLDDAVRLALKGLIQKSAA